jgi:hypothetical protein
MDTVWTVVGIIAGAMYAAGLAMIAAPEKIAFAKFLFWGSAVLLGVWCLIWEFATDAPMLIRVIVGLLVGAFVFVVVPETIRRMTGATSPPTNQMGNVSGNRGIVTQDQKGDNTLPK